MAVKGYDVSTTKQSDLPKVTIIFAIRSPQPDVAGGTTLQLANRVISTVSDIGPTLADLSELQTALHAQLQHVPGLVELDVDFTLPMQQRVSNPILQKYSSAPVAAPLQEARCTPTHARYLLQFVYQRLHTLHRARVHHRYIAIVIPLDQLSLPRRASL